MKIHRNIKIYDNGKEMRIWKKKKIAKQIKIVADAHYVDLHTIFRCMLIGLQVILLVGFLRVKIVDMSLPTET